MRLLRSSRFALTQPDRFATGASTRPCPFAVPQTVTILNVQGAPASAFAANPITPEGEFLSDPAPRTGPDGTLYVFGSRDVRTTGGAYCTHFNDVFETRDLCAWTARRGVLASTGANDGVPASDAPLYAPDAIFHNGKWHIFYCMPDKSHREGVASADTPSGPFKASFAYAWAKQIDPSVFRDDDGTVYYFWGQFSARGAVLKPDLSDIEPGTLHTGVIDEARHNFHEGIQLTKRGGVYYLVFADISRRGVPARKALYVVAAEDPWDESPKVRTVSFEGAGKVTAFAANGPVPLRRTADGRHYAFDLKSNGAVLVVFEM